MRNQRRPVVEDMVVFTNQDQINEDKKKNDVETDNIIKNFYAEFKIPTGATYFWKYNLSEMNRKQFK